MDLVSIFVSLVQFAVTIAAATMLALLIVNYNTTVDDDALLKRKTSDPVNPEVAAAERLAASKIPRPDDVGMPPISLLRKKWQLPQPVAKELAIVIDLIMRDFIMSWFSMKTDGTGLSDDDDFLAYIQYIIADAVGNVACRAMHVNPLSFVLEDVTEALRHHLYWYEEMKARAHNKQPDIFATYSDEQLLEAAKSRQQTGLFVNTAGSTTQTLSIELSDAALITSEKRWLIDQQERAILAEYAKVDVLHVATSALHGLGLGASATSPSWTTPRQPSAVTPPEMKTQHAYLRTLIPQLLTRLVPDNEAKSTGLSLLVRELLAVDVLCPALSALDPDVINYIIEWCIQKLSEIPVPEAALVAEAATKVGEINPPTSQPRAEDEASIAQRTKPHRASSATSSEAIDASTVAAGALKRLVPEGSSLINTMKTTPFLDLPFYYPLMEDAAATALLQMQPLSSCVLIGTPDAFVLTYVGPGGVERINITTDSTSDSYCAAGKGPAPSILLLLSQLPTVAAYAVCHPDHFDVSSWQTTDSTRFTLAPVAEPTSAPSKQSNILDNMTFGLFNRFSKRNVDTPVASQNTAPTSNKATAAPPRFQSASTSIRRASSAVVGASNSVLSSISAASASLGNRLNPSRENSDKSLAAEKSSGDTTPITASEVHNNHEPLAVTTDVPGHTIKRSRAETSDVANLVSVLKPLISQAAVESKQLDVSDTEDDDENEEDEEGDGESINESVDRNTNEDSDADTRPTAGSYTESPFVGSLPSHRSTQLAAGVGTFNGDSPVVGSLPSQAAGSLGHTLGSALDGNLFGDDEETALVAPESNASSKLASPMVMSAQFSAMSKHKHRWRKHQQDGGVARSIRYHADHDMQADAAPERQHEQQATRTALEPCKVDEVLTQLFAHQPAALLVPPELASKPAINLTGVVSFLGLSRNEHKTEPLPDALHEVPPINTAVPVDATVARAIYKLETEASTQIVRYLIEVSLGDYSWTIKRRYSEFWKLHQRIKETFPAFSAHIPPKKTFLLSDHYSESFLEGRRAALHTWLQAVLEIPLLNQCREVRAFLSPQDSTPVSKRVAVASSGKTSSKRPRHRKRVESGAVGDVAANTKELLGLEDETNPNGQQAILTAAELRRAEHHIFHLLNEVFDLHSRGWMRRQFVGFTRTIFRYMYSGSAASSLHDAYSQLISPDQCAFYVQMTRELLLWPGGVWRSPAPAKTWEETWKYREDTQRLLVSSMPSALLSLLGKDALESGALKIHAFLQIPVLARSLLYTVFDLLLQRMIPGIQVYGLQHPPPNTRTVVPSTKTQSSLAALSRRLPLPSLRLSSIDFSKAVSGMTNMLGKQASAPSTT